METLSALPLERRLELEQLIQQYEDALRIGPRPALEAYLPPEGTPERRLCLIELVHADLEFRLRAGERVRVEEYLGAHPILAQDREIVVELLRAEYQGRQQREPDLNPEEYQKRFPELVEDLPTFLRLPPRPARVASTEAYRKTAERPWPRLAAVDSPARTRANSGVEGKADGEQVDGGPLLPEVPGYEILAELGKGGMGIVYKARHRGLNRLVALKMIRAGSGADEKELLRFRIEAEAIARLQHPNIVQVFDVGECAGMPFLSLEFCDGGSLARKLSGTTLPPKAAAALIETLARAVHAGHQRLVLHRDLKPGNILLTEDGTPKITDFGLAKQLDQTVGPTSTGTVLGTPSYMAPEQASGKTKDFGPAVDVYALGAILYECLTGQPPFKAGAPLKTLLQVIRQEPVPPRRLRSRIPRDLEAICLKCLGKDPGQRYDSAHDLADELRRWQEGHPIQARRRGPFGKVWLWQCRHPVLAAILLGLIVFTVCTGVAGLIGKEQMEAAHTAALLADQLRVTETSHVPEILERLGPYRSWAEPRLREMLVEAEQRKDAKQQLHVSLALLPMDPGQVDYLYGRLLDGEAHEVAVLRAALAPHQAALVAKLWTVAEQPPPGKARQLLCAACALATFDPVSPRWQTIQERVAAELIGLPAVHVAGWLEPLRPVRRQLVDPLAAIARDRKRRETERSLAAEVLADYAADQPKVLAEVLLDADAQQFGVLVPRLLENGERDFPVLLGELDSKLPANAGEEARLALARRQANAAVALLRLGRPEPAWQLLKHSPEPTARSYLVHRLGPLGTDARVLVEQLAREPDVTVRRALVLSLASTAPQNWGPGERQRVSQRLQELYRTDLDPGLHGAAEWLLREWGQGDWLQEVNAAWATDAGGKEKRLKQIAKVLAKAKDKAPPQWYVNGQGQTMVVIPGPATFAMGSPPAEPGRFDNEMLHTQRIGRSFALASKPVTVAQFRPYSRLSDKIVLKRFAPTDDCPVHGITWFEAAGYCNWLSQREGLQREQWCYETNLLGQVTGLKPNYLSLPGYRLPTEAEWEYACRAGAVTSRYYGDGDELLEKYGWYVTNAKSRSWPLGSLKPNDLGLFDMHSNVFCWCQESFRPYRPSLGSLAAEDIEDKQSIQFVRVLRGGTFYVPAENVRSARRDGSAPANRSATIGFRPARTVLLQ